MGKDKSKPDKAPGDTKPRRSKLGNAFGRRSITKKGSKGAADSSADGSAAAKANSNAKAAQTQVSAFVKREGLPKAKRPSRVPSSMFCKYNPVQLEQLPSLNSVRGQAKLDLMLKKLEQCCHIFDFTDPLTNLKSKEIKRNTLIELVAFFSVGGLPPDGKTRPIGGNCPAGEFMTEPVYEAVIKVFAVNCLRPLGPPTTFFGAEFDLDEDDPVLEAAWPHMLQCFDLMLLFLECKKFKTPIAKKYLTASHIRQLLENFKTEDGRERDMLKTVLHRVYGKMLNLRGFIRRSIQHIFLELVYEPPYKHNGIAELLEIIGSIINGFTTPIKPEHIRFFHGALGPMHSCTSLPTFHAQLTYCIAQYVDKQQELAFPALKAVLKYWPKFNSRKEVMFVSELAELMDRMDLTTFVQLQDLILSKLTATLMSDHFQVAEKALILVTDQTLVAFMKELDLAYFFRRLLAPVLTMAHSHWNRHIRNLCLTTAATLESLDKILYHELLPEIITDIKSKQSKKPAPVDRQSQWEKIEEMARKNPLAEKVQIPTIPRVTTRRQSLGFSTEDVLTELVSLDMDEQAPSTTQGVRRRSILPSDPQVLAAMSAHHAQHVGTADEE
eukprot:TRINITY_DN7567_c0_g1_i2.p1 TRINITY_DN7567_c0_g1~~TRINITY_DN7567_c0_g1_i2.p1  ORF type:complete len:610 (+),score=115.56 TRINITY_DN7567_c0_g1_i2:69-1898(+)